MTFISRAIKKWDFCLLFALLSPLLGALLGILADFAFCR